MAAQSGGDDLFHRRRQVHRGAAKGRAAGCQDPAGGRLLEPVEIHNQTSQFDLTLAVGDGGRELAVGLEYDRGLFEPATAERMLMHFRNLLTAIVADPEQRLSELALGADGTAVRAAVPGVGQGPSARPAEVAAAEAAIDQPGDDPGRQARLSQRRAGLSAQKRELLRRRLRRQQVDPT